MALHLGKSKGCAVTLTHNQTIGRRSKQKWLQQHRCNVLNMSVNGASKSLGLAFCTMNGICHNINA